MNFKKAINALVSTRDKTYSLEEALSHPNRWESYWMLYRTEESKDKDYPYEKWIGYVDYVRSKSE